MVTTPIYADRATGETFADASSMVNAYLSRFRAKSAQSGPQAGASTLSLDETGFVQVEIGSVTIGVNVLERQGVLMLFAPVMQVPVTGREAFYRRLLELSFVTTSDAAFAIDPRRDEVVLRALRRLSSLDYEEFEDLLATVGDVADTWDGKLIEEYGT